MIEEFTTFRSDKRVNVTGTVEPRDKRYTTVFHSSVAADVSTPRVM